MGAFLSGENVARQQDVEANFLSQTDANKDYVRRIPYEEDKNTMRLDLNTNITRSISDLRGGYNDTLKQMNDDYISRLTSLRGEYGGNLSDLQSNLRKGFSDDLTTLRGDYDGKLSGLQTTLSNKFTGDLSTLRGDYNGTLSEMQQGFAGDLKSLRGGYDGTLFELEKGFNGNLNTGINQLRVNLTDEFNNELTTLRGAYGGNLGELQTTLRKGFSDDLSLLRGDYDGKLSTMTTETNSKYATLEQLFGEFKTTYDTDKADIISRADTIEDLINRESSSIKTKFDNELASFRTEYNQRLGNYALNSRVEGLNKTIDAGLTAEDISTIKAVINSSNFSNLFNDLKNRGVITDVASPTPAQFLRHLRSRNYVIY